MLKKSSAELTHSKVKTDLCTPASFGVLVKLEMLSYESFPVYFPVPKDE